MVGHGGVQRYDAISTGRRKVGSIITRSQILAARAIIPIASSNQFHDTKTTSYRSYRDLFGTTNGELEKYWRPEALVCIPYMPGQRQVFQVNDFRFISASDLTSRTFLDISINKVLE